jgi:hypothetical protein
MNDRPLPLVPYEHEIEALREQVREARLREWAYRLAVERLTADNSRLRRLVAQWSVSASRLS